MKAMKLLPILLIVLLSGCQQAIDYADNASVNNVSNNVSTARATGAKQYPYTTTSFNIAKPSNRTQVQINNEVKSFYDYWYGLYVTESTTHAGEYYIIADANGAEPQSWRDAGITPITQSEAHGYGMILTAIMGDKTAFDGLVKTYNRYRSVNDSNLMSWIVPSNEDNSFRDTSATDGDLDIAYAFLLADNQWGSNGAVNYKAEALRMIVAIKNSNFDATSKKSMPGDWGMDSHYSRSSDWMVSHFRVFKEATDITFWDDAANTVYRMINEIQTTYSPNTGLLPDFVINDPAAPDTQYQIEGENDQYYSYNACRTPWRIAMDYGYNGNTSSRDTMKKFVDWAIAKCNGNLDNYKAGYKLDGTPIASWTGSTFGSPLMAAVSAVGSAYPQNTTYQTFIDNNWDYMLRREDYDGYFEKTLSLLCMLYISGNWWVPEVGGNVGDIEPPQPYNGTFLKTGSTNTTYSHRWNAFTDNVGVVRYDVYRDSISYGANKVFVGSTTTPNFTHTGLEPNNKRYWVEVYAFDAAGNKSVKIGSNFYTQNFVDDEAPSIPSNISGVLEADGDVKLDWTASSDNVGVTEYVVFLHQVNSPRLPKFKYPSTNTVTYTAAELLAAYGDLASRPVYEIRIRAKDAADNYSGWKTVVLDLRSGGDVPEDPAATAKPTAFVISKNAWNGESTYKLTADMWWGQNATVVKLYENGTLIKTEKPAFASPAAQKLEFNFSGKAAGVYEYRLEAINQHGTTTSNFSYEVK